MSSGFGDLLSVNVPSLETTEAGELPLCSLAKKLYGNIC